MTTPSRFVATCVVMVQYVSQFLSGYNMKLIVRINDRLKAVPPLLVYACGTADTLILVYVGYLVSKLSH